MFRSRVRVRQKRKQKGGPRQSRLVKSSGDLGIFPILGLRTTVYSISAWSGGGL